VEGFSSDPENPRRKRRVVLVTRSLPFNLIEEEEQSQWRAEFPENTSLDSALETYMCLHENYDCLWIGSVHGEIDTSEQNTIKEQLLQERHYFPVFLDPKREKLFYQGFCKTVMWPLFHSCPPTTEDQLISHEIDGGEEDHNIEKMWQAYVTVNQAFADAVQEVYEEGDLIWVQGYHLTLLPQMIQNLFPNDNINIGFFLHIPFPSSELYRIMNNREEILTGMLGADLIGFQTYEYARHFQSACVRLLGVESSHKGVDMDGHFARVTICPIGIDAEKYGNLARSEAVQETIKQLRTQFQRKKIILGVDQMDLTKGLVHKLLAVEELFTLRPELSKEVVFLQIAIGHPGLFDTPLGSQVESLVSRINSKLQDLGAEGPVQYLSQDLSMESLIALYSLADTLVITPVRDGMNTMPFEFVVCREANGQHARVVLSEFAGCAQALGGAGATLVNPWNTEELQDALLDSLQEKDDLLQVHQRMYSYVSTFTTRQWSDNFLEQLRECSQENELPVSGRELSRRDMISAYMRSTRRLIFINYEGVLAAEASIPELAYPPQELIWQLSMLTRDVRNTVVLVCARSTSVCEQWFAGLHGNIVLAAEYGVYIKWIGEEEHWRCMVPNMDLSWWEHVVPLLEYYTERTPGAFIERKDSSVAWHYRDCDLDHGIWQASELLVSLREITRSLPVSVVPGNRYLELRPQKVSKASLFERIWEYMNCATLFPDDEPFTTDYFGDQVMPIPSPLFKPMSSPILMTPRSLLPSNEDTVGKNFDIGNKLIPVNVSKLEQETKSCANGSGHGTKTRSLTSRSSPMSDSCDIGEETSSQMSLPKSLEGETETLDADVEHLEPSGATTPAEDGASEYSSNGSDETNGMDNLNQIPVDFVLVIASGDDRTDEDLFAVLVPPPIDLEEYCRQLDKEEQEDQEELEVVGKSLQFSRIPAESISSPGESKTELRRNRHSASKLKQEKEIGSASPASTVSASGMAPPTLEEKPLKSTTSPQVVRKLFRRESAQSILGNSTGANNPTPPAAIGALHPQETIATATALSRIPPATGTAETDLLSMSNLAPLYASQHVAAAAGTKASISEDAASMFPRALLSNTPTTARRDEITEKSKFTPRRDFPPSAALFKAMKTKYGENFAMHKIPDTPAACWALVVPPNARAKLEDENATEIIPSSTSSAALGGRKSSGGTGSLIADINTGGGAAGTGGGMGNSVFAELSTTSSTEDNRSSLSISGEDVIRHLQSMSPTPSEEESTTLHRQLSNEDEAQRVLDDQTPTEESDDIYRLPVNTFVCTLGRKLSQAPYYIKNSADLFQLLQEMGLSSHLRTQRYLSTNIE
jgi:trehalose 6-phosphate synthase/phosphatase